MAITCTNSIKRISQGLFFKNGSVFVSAFLLYFSLSLAATITVINDPVRTGVGDDVTLGISIDETVAVCTWYRGAVQNSNIILRVASGVQTEGPKYTHRESLLQPSHSLRIAKATLEDSGTYSVIIVFTSFKQDQSSVTLKVFALGITVINDPVLAALGDDVTLAISINGRVGVCTWYRGIVQDSNIILRVTNGVQTEGPKYTHRESLLLPSHSLRITDNTLEDNGTFLVQIVFTSFEMAQSSVTLKVLERVSKPFISSNKTSPVENDTVALN